MESVYTYNYRIHVAGEIDPNKLDLLKYNLQKFSPVKISEPKTTPIQKTLSMFPEVENERVTTIEVEFRYPATEPMVKQLAQLLGIDENKVRVVGTKFDDSVQEEHKGFQNQVSHSPLLMHGELEEQPGAKQASKEYSSSYLSTIKNQTKDSKIDIPYEKKTPTSFDPFKPYQPDSGSEKSPMTTIKRPPKPETGARK